jgi:hypothetical protein
MGFATRCAIGWHFCALTGIGNLVKPMATEGSCGTLDNSPLHTEFGWLHTTACGNAGK